MLETKLYSRYIGGSFRQFIFDAPCSTSDVAPSAANVRVDSSESGDRALKRLPDWKRRGRASPTSAGEIIAGRPGFGCGGKPGPWVACATTGIDCGAETFANLAGLRRGPFLLPYADWGGTDRIEISRFKDARGGCCGTPHLLARRTGEADGQSSVGASTGSGAGAEHQEPSFTRTRGSPVVGRSKMTREERFAKPS